MISRLALACLAAAQLFGGFVDLTAEPEGCSGIYCFWGNVGTSGFINANQPDWSAGEGVFDPWLWVEFGGVLSPYVGLNFTAVEPVTVWYVDGSGGFPVVNYAPGQWSVMYEGLREMWGIDVIGDDYRLQSVEFWGPEDQNQHFHSSSSAPRWGRSGRRADMAENPEPESGILLGLGLVALAWFCRGRRRV